MPERIGLFGGTFDPVHKGHQSIADSFLRSEFISELWILLTPYPPHKSSTKQASYKTRLQMLEEVFSETAHVKINTIENTLPKPSYSVLTIRYLKNAFPDNTFYFCMGEDSLTQFHTWKFNEEILDECKLLVAERPGADHSKVDPKILSRTHFVEHIPLDISSTRIKEKIQTGEPFSEDIPESVFNIIKKEQLYF